MPTRLVCTCDDATVRLLSPSSGECITTMLLPNMSIIADVAYAAAESKTRWKLIVLYHIPVSLRLTYVREVHLLEVPCWLLRRIASHWRVRIPYLKSCVGWLCSCFSSLLWRFSPRFPCSPPSTKTDTHPRLSPTLLFSCFYCVLNFRRGTIFCNIFYYCNTCFDYTARVDQNYARRSVQRSWEIFLVCFNEVERQLFHALVVCSYNHEKALYLMFFVLLCRFDVYFALKR